jgi:hypothetical protein
MIRSQMSIQTEPDFQGPRDNEPMHPLPYIVDGPTNSGGKRDSRVREDGST